MVKIKKLNRNAYVLKRSLLWRTSLWIKTLQFETQNLHISKDTILKFFVMNC